MTEKEIFELIKKRLCILREQNTKPIRVAINGIEGTGKTVFAGKLTEYLNSENINALQVSIDGFHFNKEIRYRQGQNSAKGYYEDSYDELAFVEKVLMASQAEIPTITEATHNLETDEYLSVKPIEIPNKTVLITDGAYLFKPNYRDYWDLKIYLKTSFTVAMNRGVERDKDALGGTEATKAKFINRYHKASQLYQQENNPEQLADIIINNSDFHQLKVIKI